MKKMTVFSICAAAALLIPVVASAETYDYNWSYSSTGVNVTVASGTLIADDLGGTMPVGQYQIDSFSGTLMENGNPAQAVTLNPAVCGPQPCTENNGIIFWDNLLFDPAQAGSMLDGAGIDFTTTDGTNYNLFNGPDQQYVQQINGNFGQNLDAPGFSAYATPEPGSIFLIGGGLTALGLIRRRVRS